MMRISCPEARQMVSQGAQLIDVRSPSEHAMGAAPGSMNIPVQVLGGYMGNLNPDQPVIVYCASGGRSSMAASMLKSAGFDQVHDLGGVNNYFTCA